MNKILIVFLAIFTTTGCAQKKEIQSMDEMWGNQKEVGTSIDKSKTALFDDGNYSMFIQKICSPQ